MFLIKVLSFLYSVGDDKLEITSQGARAEASLNPAKKGNDKTSNLMGTEEKMGRFHAVVRLF